MPLSLLLSFLLYFFPTSLYIYEQRGAPLFDFSSTKRPLSCRAVQYVRRLTAYLFINHTMSQCSSFTRATRIRQSMKSWRSFDIFFSAISLVPKDSTHLRLNVLFALLNSHAAQPRSYYLISSILASSQSTLPCPCASVSSHLRSITPPFQSFAFYLDVDITFLLQQ